MTVLGDTGRPLGKAQDAKGHYAGPRVGTVGRDGVSLRFGGATVSEWSRSSGRKGYRECETVVWARRGFVTT